MPHDIEERPKDSTERKVGKVLHYYTHLNVAAVQLADEGLQVGDRIHIKGHTTDLQQQVESMQIDKQPVPKAGPGATVGLRVTAHVRAHDTVYKVV